MVVTRVSGFHVQIFCVRVLRSPRTSTAALPSPDSSLGFDSIVAASQVYQSPPGVVDFSRFLRVTKKQKAGRLKHWLKLHAESLILYPREQLGSRHLPFCSEMQFRKGRYLLPMNKIDKLRFRLCFQLVTLRSVVIKMRHLKQNFAIDDLNQVFLTLWTQDGPIITPGLSRFQQIR